MGLELEKREMSSCFIVSKYKNDKLKRSADLEVSDAEIIFIERSLYSDRAFHHISYFLNKIDTKEMFILQEFYDDFKKNYPGLNGVIYVATDVEECWNRIKKRARKGEEKINLAYLKMLDEQFMNTEYGCKVVTIDGNYDLKTPKSMLDGIKKFIK